MGATDPDQVADLLAVALGYARAVDTMDGTAFADLFTPDGELWVPKPGEDGTPTVRRSGREQLEQIPSGLARYTVTHHALFRVGYEVADHGARGELYGVAHHLVADDPDGAGGTDTVWHLRYVDDYVRTDGRWLLARRALHRLAVEERRVARVATARPGDGPT